MHSQQPPVGRGAQVWTPRTRALCRWGWAALAGERPPPLGPPPPPPMHCWLPSSQRWRPASLDSPTCRHLSLLVRCCFSARKSVIPSQSTPCCSPQSPPSSPSRAWPPCAVAPRTSTLLGEQAVRAAAGRMATLAARLDVSPLTHDAFFRQVCGLSSA